MSAARNKSTAMRLPSLSASTAERAATVAGIGFGVVATFQLLRALGAPWGRAALGGANEGTLPPGGSSSEHAVIVQK